ncbi:MAG: low molecular weight phosphatase family protein [Chitinophagaceae bacterium]
MNTTILQNIASFSAELISPERKQILQPLIHYVQQKVQAQSTIRLNFICTHNSRRSHLSQIWAQTMANHFNIKNLYCFSGGTEATAMYPKIVETLIHQGFEIEKLSQADNPVYAVKYALNEMPIVCFSKVYQHAFNPQNEFAAIMTCNNADEGCPVVFGAEIRIPIKYTDPKIADNTPQQMAIYAERSLQIAQEMWYVFSKIQ